MTTGQTTTTRGTKAWRRIRHACTVGLMAALVLPLAVAGIAKAAPPNGVRSVTISGDGIDTPLALRSDTNPALFNAVLDQVNWLHDARYSSPPENGDLGPKFTVVLLIGEVPRQTYDLYPLASGGPRAFRPADQPDRRSSHPGWFFGRLSMPEVLRAAGAPLPRTKAMLAGNISSLGEISDSKRLIPDNALELREHLTQAVGDLRRLILLNGAVVLIITVGLAGTSLLVRRRAR